MSRISHHNWLNVSGQHFRLYVGFGNELKISVDAAMPSPPPTFYPEPVGMVPRRPTANLGPNRLGFVGEPLPFYGGYSYGRWRRPAHSHQWYSETASSIQVTVDDSIIYPEGSGTSCALITWDEPGIHMVSMTCLGHGDNNAHTGYRQVIIYPSREEAFSGVTKIGAISGNISGGGFQTTLEVNGDMSFLMKARDLDGYIPVVIFAEQFYEIGYRQWIRREFGPNWFSGYFHEDPRIIFSGYIDKSTVVLSADEQTTTFSCRTADMILEQMQSGTWGFFENAIDGAGITFNDLQTHDVIRHMLQEHTNFIDWHDTRLFYTFRDYDESGTGLEYEDFTWGQGMYWSNIRDIAENQFEDAFMTPQSSLVVGPRRNMWEPQIYERPENPIGHVRFPLEGTPISILTDQYTEGQNQCVPLEIKITERMSQAVSYYKIIGSLSFSNEEWGADYPHGKPAAASGKWVLVQGKYFSDDHREFNWNQLWHFAARGFAASNVRYTLHAVFGMHTYWRLGDLVEVIFEDLQGRLVLGRGTDPDTGEPNLSHGSNGNWFQVIGISYDINFEEYTWQTVYELEEVTSYTAPIPDVPACPPPPKPAQEFDG